MQAMLDDPRYPIGRYQPPAEVTPEMRAEWIDRVAGVPASLRAALAGLSAEQMDTPYREGGWTVRQVAHHVPDSHMNAYTRFKLALTEDGPTIKPYAEAAWAELPDSRVTPVEVSLTLLEALHHRWVLLLRAMDDAQWARAFEHPDMGTQRLDRALGLYAWHGDHHIAQVTGLRARRGW
jgi:uncharacterized damage-inducible protein DinB